MHKKLLIIGARGHARICAEAAQSMGQFDQLGFISPDGGNDEKINGIDHFHGDLPDPGQFPQNTWCVFVGIGDNSIRSKLYTSCKKLGYAFATIVHSASHISPSASISESTLVCAQAAVQANTCINRGVIVSTSASVDHDCRLDDFSSVAPGANLAGNVSLGKLSSIGIGTSVLPNIQIGDNIIVGGGACVITPLSMRGTYVGVPATKKNNLKS